MGSRYFFIVAYMWLENISRGDYRKNEQLAETTGAGKELKPEN